MPSQVFAWGQDTFEDRAKNTELFSPHIVDALSGAQILSISCSWWHACVVLENGSVLVWGENKDGELGLGNMLQPVPTPTVVPGLSGSHIVKVACNGDLIGAHTLFLDNLGRVWSSGRGSHGQLGHDSVEDELTPRMIRALHDERIANVACGGGFSMAITETGVVYGFGNGSHGRLGLGDTHDRVLPEKVTGTQDVEHIACGERHTICATRTGLVYAWGASKEGQLGIGPVPENATQPRWVESLKDYKIQILATGTNHSCAVDENGVVFVWGGMGNACLGHGDIFLSGDDAWQFPRSVKILTRSRVIAVAGGETHTVAVTEDGLLYNWGRGCMGTGESNVVRPTPSLVMPLQQYKSSAVACGNWRTLVLCPTTFATETVENLFATGNYSDVDVVVAGEGDDDEESEEDNDKEKDSEEEKDDDDDDGINLECHKVILATRSVPLKVMMQDTTFLELREVQSDTVQILMECIYTDFIDPYELDDEKRAELLSLASDLEISCVPKILDGDFAGLDTVQASLSRAYRNMEDFHPNVRFVVEGQEIFGHRAIIASTSSYFDAFFKGFSARSRMLEMSINNCTYPVFKAILSHVYGEIVSFSGPEQAWEVLMAAHRFALPHLPIICENYLETTLTADNVADALNRADAYNCWHLKEVGICFILREVPEVQTVLNSLDDHLVEEFLARLELRTLEKMAAGKKLNRDGRGPEVDRFGNPKNEEEAAIKKEITSFAEVNEDNLNSFLRGTAKEVTPLVVLLAALLLAIPSGHYHGSVIPLVNGTVILGFFCYLIYSLRVH